MSVRIYQLSKQLDMSNKQLVTLLQQRGFKVEGPSNTIPDVYAEALIREFKPKNKAEASLVNSRTLPSEAAPLSPQAAAEHKPQDNPQGAPRGPGSTYESRPSPIPTSNPAPKVAPTVPPAGQAVRSSPPDAPRDVPARAPLPQGSAPRPPAFTPKTTPQGGTPTQSGSRPPSAGIAPVASQRSAYAGPGHFRAAAPANSAAVHGVGPLSAKTSGNSGHAPSASHARSPMPPPPPSPKGNQAPSLPPLPPRTSPSALGPKQQPAIPPYPALHSGSRAPSLAPVPSAPSKANSPTLPPTPSSPKDSHADSLPALTVKAPIVVKDFAFLLGVKPFKLISELMEMGIFASMNQAIEESIAVRLAHSHGYRLDVRHRGSPVVGHPNVTKTTPTPAESEARTKAIRAEKVANAKPRPPIVCVLGHVDHGKTTLLDALRHTNVVAGEAGGITQHIGAYQVTHKGQKITFIDTPGHAAFSKMRERGANITDIAILVVAADDGFMPQTDEALKFAQKASVPLVVAINKMDAKGANLDRVKQQMQQRQIAPEDWGGQTLCTPISALKQENLDTLLELVLLQAEMMEIKAVPDGNSEGTVIESQVEVGRGSTATVIVQEGELKIGDSIVCDGVYAKIKALFDDKGQSIKKAGPSTPVRVIGWSDTPLAGATYQTVKNEKEAKAQAEEQALTLKKTTGSASKENPKMDIRQLFEAIAQQEKKVLHIIIKADVHGSAEALRACLEGINSSKVDLDVLHCSVGNVTPSDVTSAAAAQACIVAFNTKMENGVSGLLKHHQVRLINHNIIYELIEQVKEAMAELLDPELKENKLGVAQVRQVFELSKGTIAGCMVTEGKILRDGLARLIRGKKVEHEGRIHTLKRFKDDTNEVRAGYECGIHMGYEQYQPGDTIECYEIIKIRQTL